MQARTVSLTNITKAVFGILPDLGTILRGVYYLATAKADKHFSVGQMFEQRTRENPHKIFIRYQHFSYSYNDINQWANRYAHFLASQGISQGDIVAVMLENRPETFVCVLALAKLGAIASMINTTQRQDVLVHSLTCVNARRLILGEELIEAHAQIRDQLPAGLQSPYFLADNHQTVMPQYCTDLGDSSRHASQENPLSSGQIQMKQPIYYIFTSGTTGMPKASIMTHFRWIKAMGAFGLASFRLKSEDVFYVCLPMYHNNALTVSFASAVGAGCEVVIARKFSASRFWKDCADYGVTAFCYIGELCRYLLNQPASPLDKQHQVRVMGGNGLRPDIWMAFRERFGVEHISELYGASECNIAFTNALNLDLTCGYCPMSHVVVQYDIEKDEPVRDKKGFLIEVEKGKVGLLLAEVTERSPFEGYTDPEANRKKVFRNVKKKGDVYFNSGDLVQRQGYKHVAFIDRLGDTFRWKGENVATTEVEEVANQFQQIAQSVVYGVQVPNSDGRAGMAAITLNTELNRFDGQAFAQHVRQKLPAYAVPVFIRIREEQEITGTFKYKKVDLKNQGFDPSQVQDPLFILLPNSDRYVPVTHDTVQAVNQGSIQL